MPPSNKAKSKPKITLSGLGRARYHNCAATFYLNQLEEIADYYDQPHVRAAKANFAKEGSLSDTEYKEIMVMLKRYQSKLADTIGEDKYQAILQEEAELIEEKQRLLQEASSEKDGNAAIIYHKKLPPM